MKDAQMISNKRKGYEMKIKNVMVMAGILTVAVALTACGKDSQSSEPESADEALQRINEELNAIIEEERREAEEKEAQGYPEGVIPDGSFYCADAAQTIIDMGGLVFKYWAEYDSRRFNRGRYRDQDVGIYTYDSETGSYQFDVHQTMNGEQILHYEFEGHMDDSGNLILTHVVIHHDNKEDEEYSDLEWVYIRQ